MEELIRNFKNLKMLTMYVKDYYWVDVTHVNSPHDFFVRLIEYRGCMKDLEKAGVPITENDINYGAIVIYESPTINKKVRGFVVRVVIDDSNLDLRCHIYAMDYGCLDESVPLNNMWTCFMETNVDPLAIHCKLYLCMPNGLEWSEKDVNNMKFFVNNDYAKIRICGVDSMSYVVELYCGGSDDVSTLMALIGSSNFGYISNTVISMSRKKPLCLSFKYKQLRVGDKLHVRLQNGRSLQNFYVATLDDYRQYRRYLKDFKEHCKRQNEAQFSDVSIGQTYGVFLSEENSYERGLVRKVIDNQRKIEIYLVDRGQTITVPWEYLKSLGQMQFEQCSISIHCCAEGGQTWDNYLRKLLYPGVKFYIVIRQLGDGKKPNIVSISVTSQGV